MLASGELITLILLSLGICSTKRVGLITFSLYSATLSGRGIDAIATEDAPFFLSLSRLDLSDNRCARPPPARPPPTARPPARPRLGYRRDGDAWPHLLWYSGGQGVVGCKYDTPHSYPLEGGLLVLIGVRGVG